MEDSTTPRAATLAGLALPVLLALAPAARAESLYSGLLVPHFDWNAYVGAAWTDNATLVTGGPKDTIEAAGVDAALYRKVGGLTADVNGDLHREHYVDHTFRDETLGRGIASLDYAFVPQRFTWVATDAFGQMNANPFLPSTPRNRVSANVLTTGPEGRVRLGTATSLSLGAAYERADFGHSTLLAVDNHRYSAHLGLIEQLSATSTASLNASAARVDYRGTGSSGYDQDDLYASYASRSVRAGLELDVGGTQIRGHGRTLHDPLVRATLFRRLSPSWNLNLSAGTQVLNSGQAFLAAVSGVHVVNGVVVPPPPGTAPGGGYTDALLTPNVDRQAHARAALDFVRPRTQFGLFAGYTKDRFEFSPTGLDRTITDAGFRVSRRMRPSFDGHLSASLYRREPQGLAPGDRTLYGALGATWHLGSSVLLDLSVTREHRTADSGGFPYDDRILYARLSYGPPRHGPGGGGALPALPTGPGQ